LVITTNF